MGAVLQMPLFMLGSKCKLYLPFTVVSWRFLHSQNFEVFHL